MAHDWRIFRGEPNPQGAEDRLHRLPVAPPWRNFTTLDDWRSGTYRPGEQEIEAINAALYLRRPLLVTGPPGVGKSSLIYAVAAELGLGRVLRWSINSRSTLAEGLYQYDAIARLRDAQLARDREAAARTSFGASPHDRESNEMAAQGRQPDGEDIGRYIKLGPLGTALLPRPDTGADDGGTGRGQEIVRPRALLIDEIDKSDIDLPNDLLHVFEEGWYEIPELVRLAGREGQVRVMPYLGRSDADRVLIEEGRVHCRTFPLVLLTSNRERDLPPAFYRRCLRLDLKAPTGTELADIVGRHLKLLEGFGDVDLVRWVEDFVKRRGQAGDRLATDQLLNLVYLLCSSAQEKAPLPADLPNLILRSLNEE